MIPLQERINLLIALGEHLKLANASTPPDALQAAMFKARYDNAWFTIPNIKRMLSAISTHYLSKEVLINFANSYNIPAQQSEPKQIGIVMAGNIPLVGFHDFMCVLLSGHIAHIKLSSKDKSLMAYLLNWLQSQNQQISQHIQLVDLLKDVDAIIATGSNNTAQYFEQYFGHLPHIIRKNRNGIGVLTGNETDKELLQLGEDMFAYFGLGCRSVCKLFVPPNYDFQKLLDLLKPYSRLALHSKYKNNYDYHLAVMLLNGMPHFAAEYAAFVESEELAAPTGVVYYEYYQNLKEVKQKITIQQQAIQVVVSNLPLQDAVPFGKAQQPKINDYADKADTLKFLLSL